MTGGLFDPLGMEPPGRARARGPLARWLAGLLLAALAILLVVSWLRDDGDRGRPVAVAPIGHVEAQPKPPAPPPAAQPPAATATALPPARDDQEVEIQNGVRIIRPRRAAPASGSQTVPVNPPGTAR